MAIFIPQKGRKAEQKIRCRTYDANRRCRQIYHAKSFRIWLDVFEHAFYYLDDHTPLGCLTEGEIRQSVAEAASQRNVVFFMPYRRVRRPRKTILSVA